MGHSRFQCHSGPPVAGATALEIRLDLSDAEMSSLPNDLDELTKFPTLRCVAVGHPQWEKNDKQLHDLRRGTQLETELHENYVPSNLVW